MVDLDGNPSLTNQSSLHFVLGTEFIALDDYLILLYWHSTYKFD